MIQPHFTQFVPKGDGRWYFRQDALFLHEGMHRFRVFLRDGTSFDYIVEARLLF